MQITKTALLVGLALAATACSSSDDPFGPDPDFATIHQEFAKPSGTFARGSELSIIGGASQQKSSSSSGGFSMGGIGDTTASGGAVTTQSLRILDSGSTKSSTWCPALANGQESGSCSCPAGGTLYYDFSGVQALRNQQGGPIDITLRVRANQCSAEGNTIDGTEYVKLKSAGTPSKEDLFMLFVLRLGVKLANDPQTHRLDVDFEYDNGKMWLAVRVDDGFVVVGTDSGWNESTKTGTVFIRDRNASWTCNLVDGKGTCTSNTGEVRSI